MLKTEDIVNGLQAIVNKYSNVAILWHAVSYLFLAVLIFFWQPSDKSLALLFCLPVISVAVFAWLAGNSFNGLLFSFLTILIILFGLKASNLPISVSQVPFMVIGILMIVFGLIYPHFIHPGSFLKYFWTSPLGLIPCPTLSILIGLLLLYNGLGSQPIVLIFIVYGLFYGIFGVLKLGVLIDLFLVFGTLTLLVKYIISLKV